MKLDQPVSTPDAEPEYGLIEWAIDCLAERRGYLADDFDPIWPKTLTSHVNSIQLWIKRALRMVDEISRDDERVDSWKTLLNDVKSEIQALDRMLKFKAQLVVIIEDQIGKADSSQLGQTESAVLKLIHSNLTEHLTLMEVALVQLDQ